MTTTDDPLPDLMRALRSRTSTMRAQAAKDLGRLGWLAKDALPALVHTLEDDDARVREAAAQAVGQMGPEALPALRTMLEHDDKYVRRHAVWAMGRLGALARDLVGDLCRALKDIDPRTASGAAQSLGHMGADAGSAVPALAEAMRGTNIVLCRLAAKALSQIGPPALGTLIAHLQHADPFVRGESALAVGWMGPPARSAVPFLAKLVRGSKADGLGDTPPPVGILGRGSAMPAEKPDSGVKSGVVTPTAGTPADDEATPEETCRVFAAQALGRMGESAAAAVSDLKAVSQFGPEALREAAKQALRMIQDV